MTGYTCERCQGNGEIVTDWDLYLSGADDDESLDECPNCGGEGVIYMCLDEIGCVDPEVEENIAKETELAQPSTSQDRD